MGSHPAVLITGASSGIGFACARSLDAAGWRVFAGIRSPSDGERLRAGSSERLQPLLLDVTRPDHIQNALRTVEAVVGVAGLHGLVNSAGIAVGGPLEYITPDDFRRQFEVNVFGLHAVTAAALPLLRRARGRVVHIGSISGRITSPFTAPYAASKHAVEALTDALRLELAPDGIQVAVIEPGQVNTGIWAKGQAEFATLGERLPEEGMARYGSRLRVLQWFVERASRHSPPPDATAAAVLHALESDSPRLRYVVGRDARLRLLVSQLLPARWMDALVLRALSRLERRLA